MISPMVDHQCRSKRTSRIYKWHLQKITRIIFMIDHRSSGFYLTATKPHAKYTAPIAVAEVPVHLWNVLLVT